MTTNNSTPFTIEVLQGHNGAAGKRDARTGAVIERGQPVLVYWPGQPQTCFEVATQARMAALLRTTWPLDTGTSLPKLAIAD